MSERTAGASHTSRVTAAIPSTAGCPVYGGSSKTSHKVIEDYLGTCENNSPALFIVRNIPLHCIIKRYLIFKPHFTLCQILASAHVSLRNCPTQQDKK